SRHELRTVKQCQSFFGLQGNWFPAIFFQHLRSRLSVTISIDFALAYQRQRQMSQRCEVTRCSQRTLGVNYRQNILIVEIYQTLNGNQLNTRSEEHTSELH